MTKEAFVTQQAAAELLESYMTKHGRKPGCNLQYLLNDQRRGQRKLRPIPFIKLCGRILYKPADLKDWADYELTKDIKAHSGIFIIEGDTALERLTKLAVEITKH